jgi:hypothetical protein
MKRLAFFNKIIYKNQISELANFENIKDDSSKISFYIIVFVIMSTVLFFFVGTKLAFGQVTSFPWTESFESDSPTRDDWTQTHVAGASNWTFTTGSSGGSISTAYSGTSNARFISLSGTNSPITKLISPVIDLSALGSPELSFWYGQEAWVGDQNELKIYYRINESSPWVELSHYFNSISTWTEVSGISLPNPSSSYQLAFEGINNYGRANVLDAITVTGFSSACDEIPSPGNTLASATEICPGESTILSLQQNSSGNGVSYQWSESSDNINWIDVLGAENSTYISGSISANTYFRSCVSCDSYGTSCSVPILIELKALSADCYCAPTYSSGGSSDNITNVDFEGLSDNPPLNNSPYYYNRTGMQNTIPIISKGSETEIRISLGSDGYQYSRVWIDFNQNGIFEPDESFSTNTNSGSNGIATISINTPADAVTGNTLLRIRAGDDSAIDDSHSCGTSNSNWGQALDYYVNIVEAIDMVFISATATQANTSMISIGSTNQQIIGIEVKTEGITEPLSITEIVIRTDGTDDYSDIENLKIWFTGNIPSFSTTNHFGTTIISALSPGNDIAFSGSQILNSGTNYFWLSYDIPESATDGNFVDSKLQSVTIGGNVEAIDVSEPIGNRELIRGCYHYIELRDDYAPWSGSLVTIKVDEIIRLENITLSSGTSQIFEFIANTGQEISIEYTAGSSSGDNSYFVTNQNGAYILTSGEAGSVPTNNIATTNCAAIIEFTVNGSAYQYNNSCFTITENERDKNGSLWHNYKINLNFDFEIEFELFLGNNDGGADGIAFVLQGDCASAGGNGGALGYGGINNSIAVEFDTYQNYDDYGDPASDHIAIISGGSVDHSLSTNLDGPYSVNNMENGNWHNVVIQWFSDTESLRVNFNGTPTLSYTGDIINSILGGNTEVFWGFTGGTGMNYNLQQVCIIDYPQNTTQISDISICQGCSTEVHLAGGGNSYLWTPNDGSISDPTSPNPTLSPTQTTEYSCTIEDGCGNLITNKFTVYVGTLPVELGNYNAICENDKVLVKWTTHSENNNDYFLIEKSYDAINFIEIEKANGAGFSSSKIHYELSFKKEDRNVYYRLSQIDFDGKRTSFKTITPQCDQISIENNKFTISPNPAKDYFSIENEFEFENVNIKLFSSCGKLVVDYGDISDLKYLDISTVKSGVYILKISTKTYIQNIKLIVS